MATVERGHRRPRGTRPAVDPALRRQRRAPRRRRAPARRRWPERSPTSTSTTGAATSRCARPSPRATALVSTRWPSARAATSSSSCCARIFAEGGTIATVPAVSYSMYRYAALMAGATVIDDPPTGRPRLRLSTEQPHRRAARHPRRARPADHRRGLRRTTPGSTRSTASTAGRSCCAPSPRPTDWPARASATRSRRPRLTAVITSRQAPLSVSSLSAALALAALATPLDVSAPDRRARASGRRSSTELGLAPVPSYTNFLYIPMDDAGRTRRAAAALRRRGARLRGRTAHQRARRARRRHAARRAACGAARRGDPPRQRCGHRRATAETLLSVRLRVPGEGRVYVNTGRGLLRPHAPAAGVPRRDGPAPRGRGRPRDRRPPHGRGHDAHLRRGARPGAGGPARTRPATARPASRWTRRWPTRWSTSRDARPPTSRSTPIRAWRRTPSSPWPRPRASRCTSRPRGANAHHVAEAAFKAVGRALAQALTRDGSLVRSTKGSL